MIGTRSDRWSKDVAVTWLSRGFVCDECPAEMHLWNSMNKWIKRTNPNMFTAAVLSKDSWHHCSFHCTLKSDSRVPKWLIYSSPFSAFLNYCRHTSFCIIYSYYCCLIPCWLRQCNVVCRKIMCTCSISTVNSVQLCATDQTVKWN